MENIIVNNVDITNLVTSFEVYEEMDKDLIIGSAVSTQIKLKLRNRDNQLEGLLDYPFIIGDKTYIVYEKPEKWTQIISVTLYDRMILSNIAYQTSLAYPTTVREQLSEMTCLMKVEIDQTTLSEELLNKEVNWYDNTIIIRNYLGFIAQCDGKNAFIDNDKIVFKALGLQSHITDFCSDYELNELITFTRVCFDDGLNVLYKGNETKHTLYLSSNNLYATQEDIDRIYAMYKDFSFYSFKKFKCKERSVHLTDLVSYNGIIVMPLSIKRKVYGGEAKDSIELSGDITIKNADSVVVKYDQAVKIRKIQTTVDQNTQTLTIVAEQQEANIKDISNLKVSLEGIETEVSKTSNSIYKFETGNGNIFNNCHQLLIKNINEPGIKQKNDMTLDINKDYMRNKDICVSVDVEVIRGIIGTLGNYLGAEFEIGYVDGTKKTYSARWYLGQFFMQYLLQTSTLDHQERVWAHFKVDDKEITSVSNLKMIIALDCEQAIVANPKVEFGTVPTGFEFDVNYVRDNIETIQRDYTQIKQEVSLLSLQAVSLEEQITTIKGNVETVETRLQSTELKLTPTEITAMVNEKIGADGELSTTKFSLDKDGAHIKGGGLDISNNAGEKVLYADEDGNLVISGEIKAHSGNIADWAIKDGALESEFYNQSKQQRLTASIDAKENKLKFTANGDSGVETTVTEFMTSGISLQKGYVTSGGRYEYMGMYLEGDSLKFIGNLDTSSATLDNYSLIFQDDSMSSSTNLSAAGLTFSEIGEYANIAFSSGKLTIQSPGWIDIIAPTVRINGKAV